MIIAWFGKDIFSFVKCKGELTVNYRLHCRAAEIILISPPLYLTKWVPPFANRPDYMRHCESAHHCMYLWMHQTCHFPELSFKQAQTGEIGSVSWSSSNVSARICHEPQPAELQGVLGAALRKEEVVIHSHKDTRRGLCASAHFSQSHMGFISILS